MADSVSDAERVGACVPDPKRSRAGDSAEGGDSCSTSAGEPAAVLPARSMITIPNVQDVVPDQLASCVASSPQVPVPATPSDWSVWGRVKDPKSGKDYYFNEKTGEVSWNKPRPPAKPANAGTASAATPPQAHAESEPKRSRTRAPSPSGEDASQDEVVSQGEGAPPPSPNKKGGCAVM